MAGRSRAITACLMDRRDGTMRDACDRWVWCERFAVVSGDQQGGLWVLKTHKPQPKIHQTSAAVSAGEGLQRDVFAEDGVADGVGVVAVVAQVGDHLGGVGGIP